MASIPMYKAIYHDRYNGLMFYWLVDGTRDAKKVNHRFYTPVPGQYGATPCNMVDIFGNAVYEVTVDGKKEIDIRNDNIGRHNLISECDIDFRTRWLQNFYKDADELKVDINDFNICFLDIEVAAVDRFPTADKADYPINCVTIYFSKFKKYYTFGLNRDIKPETVQKLTLNNCEYINCRDEAHLITLLFTTIATNEVDVLCSFNGHNFDFPYLVNRAAKKDIKLKLLSRLPEKYKTAYVGKRDNQLKIGGTDVADYLKLYKKFTLKERDNFKLETIGFAEVKEKKAPLPEGYRSYIKYWDEFVWYNFKDVNLMVQIEDKCKLFETTITACAEARVTFDSILETKKMLVGFILDFLHKKNIVMPPLKENPRDSFPGAFVYTTSGYYKNLVSYDFRSMYPSIMMGANISPETKVIRKDGKFYDTTGKELQLNEKDLVKSPWDAKGKYEVFYRKDFEGIVPQVVKKLTVGRSDLKNKSKQFKRMGDANSANVFSMREKAYKIFGNGLYGLLGNPYFQLYDVDNSASVTAFGSRLILFTTEKMADYFDIKLEKEERYFSLFGEYPTLNPKYKGNYLDDKGNACYNRMSHGDTDSFFVKYDDIYKSFEDKVGKEAEVYVFKGHELISKKKYDLKTEGKQSKLEFHNNCLKFCPTWNEYPKEKKADAFKDGMFVEVGYKIIYNRFSLTDICRIIDTAILEELMVDIMQNYANKWNYMENTLFLKREKCVNQAIVTRKKKYICNIESDEDIKIYDEKEKFKITGLEIVRSSSPPYTREHILKLVTDLLKTMDKSYIKNRYLEIKKGFFDLIEQKKYYAISVPSGIKGEPPVYEEYKNWTHDKRKKVDWRLRGASVWNHLIESDPVLKEQMLEPIHSQAKVKFVKVAPNKYGVNTIAYLGDNCPERLLDTYFIPNWKAQWTGVFSNVMDRLFIAIGWGKNFENDQRDIMMQLHFGESEEEITKEEDNVNTSTNEDDEESLINIDF